MGALEFISSLVQALAWPAAAVVIAGLLFRQQLRDVLAGFAERVKHLKTLRAPGTELTFDSDELAGAKIDLAQISVAEARQAVPGEFRRAKDSGWPPERGFVRSLRSFTLAELAEPAGPPGSSAAITSRYRQRAMAIRFLANGEAPAGTVLAAWSCVESLLREIGGLLGISDTGSLALLADEVITELYRRGGLPAPDQALSVVQRLLRLKFPVEHGADVTKLEAIGYAETALEITDLLLTAYTTTRPLAAPESPEQAGSETTTP